MEYLNSSDSGNSTVARFISGMGSNDASSETFFSGESSGEFFGSGDDESVGGRSMGRSEDKDDFYMDTGSKSLTTNLMDTRTESSVSNFSGGGSDPWYDSLFSREITFGLLYFLVALSGVLILGVIGFGLMYVSGREGSGFRREDNVQSNLLGGDDVQSDSAVSLGESGESVVVIADYNTNTNTNTNTNVKIVDCENEGFNGSDDQSLVRNGNSELLEGDVV